MKELYDIFEKLDIEYEKLEHEAVFTVEEALKIEGRINGLGCKNLFMKDKKKNFYLYVLREDKRADLKQLGKDLGTSNFRFCDEETLWDLLKLTKGSGTPLGIINDTDNQVTLIIDKDLDQEERLLVHPNRNTATVAVSYSDLIKFIEHENHEYIIY